MLGVHFRPGGAFPFLPLPADELHGLHVSLRNLWGGFARELRERLLATDEVEARFDLIEGALMGRLVKPMGHHPAVRFALGEFHRRVQRTVAGAPKVYSRVRRFQHVVGRLPLGQAVDWCETALAAGYFDQSHLIHEFQTLSGISPGMWAELRTDHTNHVPLAG